MPEKAPPPSLLEDGPKPGSDSHPKQSLRKLQLSTEERSALGNLQSFSADSDSETHGGSSSCSSSSANAGGPLKPGLDGQEEEGYWSGSTASHFREKKTRRCLRKKEMLNGQSRPRSKFSPWNLSSPRISRDPRLSVHVGHPGSDGENQLFAFFVLRLGSFQLTFASPAADGTFAHVTSEKGIDGDDDDDDEDDMFEQDDDDQFEMVS